MMNVDRDTRQPAARLTASVWLQQRMPAFAAALGSVLACSAVAAAGAGQGAASATTTLTAHLSTVALASDRASMETLELHPAGPAFTGAVAAGNAGLGSVSVATDATIDDHSLATISDTSKRDVLPVARAAEIVTTTAPGSPVPEPTTWAMLIVGLGVVTLRIRGMSDRSSKIH